MLIAIIILVFWVILGGLVLMRQDDPTPLDYALTWIALIIVLLKDVFNAL